MYEISLVPEVKAQLLRKQKMRNLVILFCIGISVACVILMLLLGSVIGGQKIALNSIDNELSCRQTGKDMNKRAEACLNVDGTPIAKFQNLNSLLSIQDQLASLDALNKNKIKYSRVFGLMDVLLLDGEDGDSNQRVTASSIEVDFSKMALSFKAKGVDMNAEPGKEIGYKPLETFKKNALKSYYDYGEYVYKGESGTEKVIPSYCVDEFTEPETGEIYGVYRRFDYGCEYDMVDPRDGANDDKKKDDKKGDKKDDKNKDDKKGDKKPEGENSEEQPKEEAAPEIDEGKLSEEEKESLRIEKNKEARRERIELVLVRRTYRNEDTRDKIIKGDDKAYEDIDSKVPALVAELSKNPLYDGIDIASKLVHKPNYYFKSNCIQLGEDKMVDEEAALQKCGVIAGGKNGIVIDDDNFGKDDEDKMVLTFEATLNIAKPIFMASSRNIRIVSPSRQNVTDSYVEIRDMFDSSEITVVEGSK